MALFTSERWGMMQLLLLGDKFDNSKVMGNCSLILVPASGSVLADDLMGSIDKWRIHQRCKATPLCYSSNTYRLL